MNVFLAFLSLFMVSQRADMILYHGKIMTMNPNLPYVEAVAIRRNKVIAIGSDEEILKLKTKRTKLINLKGRLALPGFNDSHLHFLSGAKSLFTLDLNNKNEDEIAALLKERLKSARAGEWIEGRGWDQYFFKGKKFPTKEFLDKIAPNNPIAFKRVCGHILWVNSKALEIAGINKNTKSPKGGEIVKDRNGEPTGILKENAAELVYKVIPEMDFKTAEKYILKALDEAKKYGVTSIQDNSSLLALEVYKYLYKRGKLTLRVSFWGDFYKSVKYNLKVKRGIERYNSKYLRFGLIKGFMDGTLGARTAKMFFPYADDPATSGMFTMDLNELFRKTIEFNKAGLQVGFHAIGDYAVWMALKAFEAAEISSGRKDLRNRIEHSQTVRLSDMDDYKKWNVIASMQPSHMLYDYKWAEKRLGKERSKGAYAWNSFIKKGVHVAFGTDWPIVPLNPMIGLYASVMRANFEGEPIGGWIPDEKISLFQAIYNYTVEGAYTTFEENIKGKIVPGMLADIIVLSNDITSSPYHKILKTKVDITILDGKIIYERK